MICHWHPRIGDQINKKCPECGHFDTLHIGCDSCTVCELIALRDDIKQLIERDRSSSGE